MRDYFSVNRRSSSYRPDIQALRGFAVLTVLFYHLNFHLFKGGFLGVDVFFVVSGFVITETLIDSEGTYRERIFRFYRRRVQRIFPSGIFVVVVISILSLLFLPPVYAKRFTFDGILSIVMVANWGFVSQKLNYLQQTLSPSPYLHYWSLGVEEQFYLIWPMILLSMKRKRLMAAALALPAFFVVAIVTTNLNPIISFYSPTSRAWEFLAGAVIALGGTFIESKLFSTAVAGIGWLGLVYSVIFIGNENSNPGISTLIPVIAACLVLVSRASSSSLGVLEWVGGISFTLYLVHWPAILVAEHFSATLTLVGKFRVGLLSIAVAYLLTILLEKPFRFNPALFFSMKTWVLVVVVSGSLVAGVLAFDTIKQSNVKNKFTLDTTTPVIYRDGCHLSSSMSKPNPNCVFGATNSTRSIFLIGDSHAAQWFPALEKIATDNHLRLLSATKSSCPATFYHPMDTNFRVMKNCVIWQQNVLNLIRETKPSLVVIGELTEARYPAKYSEIAYAQKWSAGLATFLNAVLSTQSKVLYMQDTPNPSKDSVACVSDHPNTLSQCNIPEVRSRTSLAVESVISRLGVASFDARLWLCNNGSCPAIINKHNTYRDGSHISVSTSLYLSQFLGQKVKSLLR